MKTVCRCIAASLALGLGGALLPAAAQSPAQRGVAELTRFERYASPPQDSMHYFRSDGFQYLGPDARGNDAVAIWTGVNDVYLIKVWQPCINLEYARGIGLTSTSGSVNARMDDLVFDHQRCRIETIQKVDYRAMKADKAR